MKKLLLVFLVLAIVGCVEEKKDLVINEDLKLTFDNFKDALTDLVEKITKGIDWETILKLVASYGISYVQKYCKKLILKYLINQCNELLEKAKDYLGLTE